MSAQTKAEIILAAEQNVQRGSELDTIANYRLNLILDQLYENFTFEFLSQNLATLTLPAGNSDITALIPADYAKFLFMRVIRTDLSPTNPSVYPVPKITYPNYLQIINPYLPGQPQVVAFNRIYSDGVVQGGAPNIKAFVWPVPDISYTANLAYYYTPAFDPATNLTMTFPDSMGLVRLLTNELLGMGYGKGVSGLVYDPNMMKMVVADYRRNQADMGIYPSVAPLDGRVFQGRPGNWWTNRSWLQ